jgi:hypothetical protein
VINIERLVIVTVILVNSCLFIVKVF